MAQMGGWPYVRQVGKWCRCFSAHQMFPPPHISMEKEDEAKKRPSIGDGDFIIQITFPKQSTIAVTKYLD